nr:MAG TPA: hypothetical protein [Caudoviricetes sp.]
MSIGLYFLFLKKTLPIKTEVVQIIQAHLAGQYVTRVKAKWQSYNTA